MAGPIHHPTGNIVWRHGDGSLSITHVFFGRDPAEWRDTMIERGDIPAGATAVAINARLPADYKTRKAWRWDGRRIAAEEANG